MKIIDFKERSIKNDRMKTINILSILIAIAFTGFITACTNDEAVGNNKNNKSEEVVQGTTFIGGIDAKAKSATRTSLEMTYPGGSAVDYFWEPGDEIWTEDGVKGKTKITTKSARAQFKLSKGYSTPTVKVYYPGQNASSYNQVTIATAQTQTAPNNSSHLGTSGDCGTATAVKQADGTYLFNLDHKAAYLCLLPRTPNNLVSTYIQQIKVTANSNIAGTYTLEMGGLTGEGSSKTITLTTKTNPKGSLYFHGFPLNNSATSQNTNSAYVVIRPGSYILDIEYTLYDNETNAKGTFTKHLALNYYAPNTVYPITSYINPTDYPKAGYYMWDAKFDYWKGYENEQPKTVNENSPKCPQIPSDERWFNPVLGYKSGNSPVFASNICKDYPNVNELYWYAAKGDPHWDISLWSTMGHLYVGGMWFKKRSKITGYDKNLAPDGKDYRLTLNVVDYKKVPTQGKPDKNKINDYFYLPALGYYLGGTFLSVGAIGTYWSSTPRPYDDQNAYYLGIAHDQAHVGGNQRKSGYRQWTAQ